MKSSHQNFQFVPWRELGYQQFLASREGEIRLGERLTSRENARFVILGIEESIGPKVNLGNGGAEKGFAAFCAKFLNMQSNTSLNGEQIALLGVVRTADTKLLSTSGLVDELDDFVEYVLKEFVSAEQVLVVIGGGHNNAFPIINNRRQALGKLLNVVNVDAHADYRALEGRHSGNPFSYAASKACLKKYFALGLHQRYNNQFTLDALKKAGHYFSFFEDYLDETNSIQQDLDVVSAELQTAQLPFGLELDMDAVENMPSSAMSPSGISMSEARSYIRRMARVNGCCYLHLPEAAPSSPVEINLVGKALSYLVTDFISCHPLSNF